MRRFLALAALAVSVAACGGDPPQEPTPLTIAAPSAPQETPETTTSLRPKVDKPDRIKIPSIKVDARIVPVGLQANRAMETPPARKKPTDPLLAGWYKDSRRPGADGPSVIVGHVDGKQGADVFADLDQLKVGQKVTVVDKAKNVVEFKVKSMERVPKDEVNWVRILNTKGTSLWLFTCDGKFDTRTRHYLDNLIIETVRA